MEIYHSCINVAVLFSLAGFGFWRTHPTPTFHQRLRFGAAHQNIAEADSKEQVDHRDGPPEGVESAGNLASKAGVGITDAPYNYYLVKCRSVERVADGRWSSFQR